MISFADFKKMELKVGEIKSAEDHPDADKLLVMQVDVGGGTVVQTIAGLKGHYQADELVGKKVVMVANLEPATLRGVESTGMMLACQEGDRVVLVVPEAEVSPGSPVL